MRFKDGDEMQHCLELILFTSFYVFVSIAHHNNISLLFYVIIFYVPEYTRYLRLVLFRSPAKPRSRQQLRQLQIYREFIIFGTANFPFELASKVFEHLNQHELLQASQVCKSWNNIVTPLLWRNPQFYHKLDKQLSDIYYAPIQTMWPISTAMEKRYFLYQSLDIAEYRHGYDCQLPLAHKLLGQHIRNLSFEFREHLVSDNTLADIALHCSSLQNLSLAGCRNITDAGLLRLSRGKLRLSLKCIDLSDCVLVTDNSLSLISHLFYRLQKVSLNGCTGISNAGIKTLVRNSAAQDLPSISRSSLQEIHIRRCHNLTGSTIKYLVITCGQSLQALDLASSACIGNTEIKVIAKHCVSLRHLNLARSKASESNIETRHSRLDAAEMINPLAATSLQETSDEILDDTIEYLVKRLPQLRYLDLSNITTITNLSVVSISKYCQNLATFILVGCDRINEESLSSLSELHRQYGQLVNITLGGSTEFLKNLVNSIKHDNNWHSWTHEPTTVPGAN
ncbi:hypothetical protein BGW37DRAFT_531482 [Umbelopsis sp. PMI_123]|nr:hypothetical protein BGW37DRAFT_531482 [Umbelopsis sp. PMI_123]